MKAFRIRGSGGLPLTVLVMILCAAAVSAAPITGGFGTTGPGTLVFNTAGANFIDWCPVQSTSPTGSVTQPLSCGTADGNNGTLQAQGGTGTFTPQNPPPAGGQAGTILDISDQPGSPTFAYLPTTGSVMLDNFIVLNTQPEFNFQAQQLLPASGGACGAAVGPFCLSQVGSTVVVQMTVQGMVYDTSGTLTSASFQDVISGQFNNTTIANVISNAQSGTGVYSNTWSGSVTTSPTPEIPEPTTTALIGSALVALGVFSRRRKASNR